MCIRDSHYSIPTNLLSNHIHVTHYIPVLQCIPCTCHSIPKEYCFLPKTKAAINWMTTVPSAQPTTTMQLLFYLSGPANPWLSWMDNNLIHIHTLMPQYHWMAEGDSLPKQNMIRAKILIKYVLAHSWCLICSLASLPVWVIMHNDFVKHTTH